MSLRPLRDKAGWFINTGSGLLVECGEGLGTPVDLGGEQITMPYRFLSLKETRSKMTEWGWDLKKWGLEKKPRKHRRK
jgi:hypothetical protein